MTVLRRLPCIPRRKCGAVFASVKQWRRKRAFRAAEEEFIYLLRDIKHALMKAATYSINTNHTYTQRSLYAVFYANFKKWNAQEHETVNIYISHYPYTSVPSLHYRHTKIHEHAHTYEWALIHTLARHSAHRVRGTFNIQFELVPQRSSVRFLLLQKNCEGLGSIPRLLLFSNFSFVA